MDFATVYVATPLEETHYYPFGLTQRGISTRQSGPLHNKEKTFQDQQIDEDLDLNWVQFKYRNHDPQIGRFIEIDPLSHDYLYNSTYAFSENKVTRHIELEGLESKDAVNRAWRELQNDFQKVANFFNGFENTTGFAIERSNSTNTKSIEVQYIVKTNTKAGDFMSYIISHNSSEGGPKLFEFKEDVKPFYNKKMDFESPLVKLETKTSAGAGGEISTTMKGGVATQYGTLEFERKENKDGAVNRVSIVESDGNSKIKGSIINDNTRKESGWGVGIKAEHKTGNTKFTLWSDFMYYKK